MTPETIQRRLCVIAAVARNGAIGRDNQLLMHLPGDLPRFKRITTGGVVLMGRKTWDSIGRPLPDRRNIVLTRNPAWRNAGAERASSLVEALSLAQQSDRVFAIGGGQLYEQVLPFADELVLTEIDADLQGDAFFPRWNRADFCAIDSEQHITRDGVRYRFITYRRTGADQHV